MDQASVHVPHLHRLWLYVLAGTVVVFLIGPIFVVIPMSFSASSYLEFPPEHWSLRWYQAYFGTTEWMDATRVSLVAAVATVALATPIGAAAAYALHHLGGRKAKLLYGVVLLPQILPVILVGIGVYFLYTRLALINTLTGIVAAHTALAVPFVVVTVLSGLQSFDANQEDAARGLGASRLRAVLDVTFPQLRLFLVAGALFAFITSLDEVVIGLFVAGGDNTVLPRKMFLALHDQIDPTIAAISTLLILLATAGMGIFLLVQRSRPA